MTPKGVTDSMKQFLKKTFPILFLLLMLAPTAFASKMSFEWTLKKLNRLQGIWYSIEDPSQTVSFDGGKFEGNQVVSFDDVAGGSTTFGCKMVLVENGYMRTRHLFVQDLGRDTPHQYIAIDGIPYRKTKEPVYGESVGGIYLGMPYQDVVKLYGTPDMIENSSNGPRSFKIGYSKIGLTVRFSFSIVDNITLYSYGDRKLDKSLLNSHNSLDEFKAAYGIEKFHEKWSNSIGNGEYIWFNEYPQSIALSTYAF